MRPLWTGFISFGLVNIPVRLYSLAAEKEMDLDLLHAKDMSGVRYARICKKEEKEIPYDEIIKGAKHGATHVPLDDADFAHANARKTSTIEVAQFADESDIDPIYYEKPYYLEPEKGGEKAYQLFHDALLRSKRVGIARFVLRNREHLSAVRTLGGAIVLEQLRFASTLRRAADLTPPARKAVSAKEMRMAMDFVTKMTRKFRPEEYKDSYTRELLRAIREKAKHGKITPRGKRPTRTEVDDLMETLRLSLKHHAAARTR